MEARYGDVGHPNVAVVGAADFDYCAIAHVDHLEAVRSSPVQQLQNEVGTGRFQKIHNVKAAAVDLEDGLIRGPAQLAVLGAPAQNCALVVLADLQLGSQPDLQAAEVQVLHGTRALAGTYQWVVALAALLQADAAGIAIFIRLLRGDAFLVVLLGLAGIARQSGRRLRVLALGFG